MKISSLLINYKIFRPNGQIKLGKKFHLLIGVNGSGKSTVLEAVAIIFDDLKKHCENPENHYGSFGYEIEYLINKKNNKVDSKIDSFKSHKVIISNSWEKGLLYTMTVDGRNIDSPKEMYDYMPDNLIFYYAGACDTLEKLIDNTEDEQAKELFNKTNEKNIQRLIDNISKNIIYIRKDYYPLLFLLNYIDNETELPLNNKKFNIKKIRFDYKQYRFTKNEDFKNLYNLTGFLRVFLDNLLQHTFDGVEYDEKNKIAFFTIEYHRGLLQAIEDLENLTDEQKFNDTRILLFNFISLLFRIGFLKKISVEISDEKGNVYSIDDLSEGEQQLIILDSIKKNLCKENTVLFLDEPDAYLHPQRQREIIPYLNNLFSESNTQIIATSHSPFVAQSVDIENILIFNNKGKYKTSTEEFLTQTTINNELFGVKSEYALKVEKKIKKFQNLVRKIQLEKIAIPQDFYDLRNELDSFGEATRFITNFETRKLISNGFEV